MLKGKVIALAIAAFALSMSQATAATKQQANYLTALPLGTTQPSVGGAHFTPPSGTSSMDVSIKDKLMPSVAFRVVFVVDEYLDIRYSAWYCGSVKYLSVPAGTKGIEVRVDGRFFRCGTPSIPTRGTITVTFR